MNKLCYNNLYFVSEVATVEFKEKIYQTRMQLNMSQESIAKELGVSFATVNRWENGKVEPNKLKQYAFDQFCLKNKIKFEDLL